MIHDILNILARRHAKVQVLLYPVAVQGEAAAGEVVEALVWFQQNPCADVLIVARGGGSLEDLAAFNSEAVARAISATAIPGRRSPIAPDQSIAAKRRKRPRLTVRMGP